MNSLRQLSLSALLLIGLVSSAGAQTYIDTLNGSDSNSTFEGVSTTSLSSSGTVEGWSPITTSGDGSIENWIAQSSGAFPRILSSTNTALINHDGGGYSSFGAQYLTTATISTGATYTLTFRMGYFSGPATGNAIPDFALGTWNGSTFTKLDSLIDELGSSAVTYNGSFSGDGTNGIERSITYTATGSESLSDVLAVRWIQTNASSGADYLGFDNVVLQVSAVPEPSTYAAICGALALAGAAWRRRRQQHVA